MLFFYFLWVQIKKVMETFKCTVASIARLKLVASIDFNGFSEHRRQALTFICSSSSYRHVSPL